MPFKSKAESRWGNSPSGIKALGGPSAVAEWNASTNFESLPEKAEGGAISRALKSRRPTSKPGPGALGKRFQAK